jgi:hypothetical protein
LISTICSSIGSTGWPDHNTKSTHVISHARFSVVVWACLYERSSETIETAIFSIAAISQLFHFSSQMTAIGRLTFLFFRLSSGILIDHLLTGKSWPELAELAI